VIKKLGATFKNPARESNATIATHTKIAIAGQKIHSRGHKTTSKKIDDKRGNSSVTIKATVIIDHCWRITKGILPGHYTLSKQHWDTTATIRR
jgi:predicted DNA-binding protein (MmcQ/YjbR family)